MRSKILWMPSLALVIILASVGGFLLVNVEDAKATPRPLLLPFPVGETWYVCQGYNGQISHVGRPELDLSVAPNSSGPNGCNPTTSNASAGKAVTSPGTGTLYNSGSEGVCINFDAGGSTYINHIGNRRANGRVLAGEQIGTVNAAGVGGNGGYAHIHIQLHLGAGCSPSPRVAFSDTDGSRFECAIDMPLLRDPNDPNKYLINQYSGTALTRCGSRASANDYNGDGKPDLYGINKVGTGAGHKTEVHIMDGANQYRSYLLNGETALGDSGLDCRWDFVTGGHCVAVTTTTPTPTPTPTPTTPTPTTPTPTTPTPATPTPATPTPDDSIKLFLPALRR